MHEIRLSPRLVRGIDREASGSGEIRNQLLRESVCSTWLRRQGIPCWRNPVTPGENHRQRARYSLLFRDGSRILVRSRSPEPLSLDITAAAGCFGVVAVDLHPGRVSGRPTGFLPFRSISPVRRFHDLTAEDLESTKDFLHYLDRPTGYRAAMLLFSIRLLFLGEPWPPEAGADGVPRFHCRDRPCWEGRHEQ